MRNIDEIVVGLEIFKSKSDGDTYIYSGNWRIHARSSQLTDDEKVTLRVTNWKKSIDDENEWYHYIEVCAQ